MVFIIKRYLLYYIKRYLLLNCSKLEPRTEEWTSWSVSSETDPPHRKFVCDTDNTLDELRNIRLFNEGVNIKSAILISIRLKVHSR